jgi:hypothetical protein
MRKFALLNKKTVLCGERLSHLRTITYFFKYITSFTNFTVLGTSGK